MPATEQTWRDSKLLHLVFGVTSLLMLVCTIWMLAADHRREWKDYQKQVPGYRSLDGAGPPEPAGKRTNTKTTCARPSKRSTEAREQVPAGTLVDRFNARVRGQAEEHDEAVNLAPVDETYKALGQASEEQRPALREATARGDVALRGRSRSRRTAWPR